MKARRVKRAEDVVQPVKPEVEKPRLGKLKAGFRDTMRSISIKANPEAPQV